MRINGKCGYWMKYLLIVVMMILSSACNKNDTSRVKKLDNSEIRVVPAIEPQFKYASVFSDGLAAVCVGNEDCKWGYIDKNGKFVINPRFNDANRFENGFANIKIKIDGVVSRAILRKNEEFIVFDSTEKEYLIRIYQDGTTDADIAEGLLPHSIMENGDRRIGFIDTTGKLQIERKYSEVQRFSEGLAAVKFSKKEDLWGFIDSRGKVIIDPQFQYVDNFKEGLAVFRIGKYKEGTYGYIDKNGKIVVPPKFKHAIDFSDGLAAVQVDIDAKKKWGFINHLGEMLIQPAYDIDDEDFIVGYGGVMSFSNGLAAVQVISRNEKKWGFIDKNGKMVIEPQFSQAYGFSDGLAGVRIGNSNDGKWGFIDTKGKFVVNPIYEDVQPFREKMAAVQTGKGKDAVWGFLEKK